MSWTYSGDPGYSDRDAVRFLMQDTDSSDQLTTNEEIDWILSTQPNVYLAAARALRTLAVKFSDQGTSKSVGGLSISYSERGSKFLETARALESSAKRGVTAVIRPYSGGISKADKEANEADSDWVKPWASYGMHDNPGASNPALSTDW